MSAPWSSIILDTPDPVEAWTALFARLKETAQSTTSPVALHDATVAPDRLLSEAAWELWHRYADSAPRTSVRLKEWFNAPSSSGRAVLILDALSLRELPLLLGAAHARGIVLKNIAVTGAEAPTTTDQFAKALGLPTRSALQYDGKPGTFALGNGPNVYTDVVNLPFEDCSVPPKPRVVLWHTWLDDLIHLQKRLPDQIATLASTVLQGDGFWSFINKLRQGRELVITADHGYAVSKRFSTEETDTEAIEVLRQIFGASRCAPASTAWENRFMPPVALDANGQHVVMGQRKWKVQGGFPHVCHGGISLLEVAVPWVEIAAC